MKWVHPALWAASPAWKWMGIPATTSQTLSTTLAFPVPMGPGDTIAMFAEGEAAAESVVPVPVAVWLFASGLIGLIGFAKRGTV